MKLLKQVFSDLTKESGWVVFYGFLTAIVLMVFILIGLSYSLVASQNSAISRFTENNITLTQLRSTTYNTASKSENLSFNPKQAETLDEYYLDVFSEQGNAGTYVIMPGRCGYQQVILLLGVYADLTPFTRNSSDAVTFAVSYDNKEIAPDTIAFNGIEYPLYIAPADMEVYHPLFYMNASSGMLKNTLFVFSRDFNAIKEIFPSSLYTELQGNPYANRLIFQSPTSQDITRMRNVITQSTGEYVTVQSISDFLKSSTESGVRTHQTYLLFYLMASCVLLGAMLINIYRVLKRKLSEYATHHLFGAPSSFIFARMFLFVLLYHVIPLAGVLFIMSVNQLATPQNLFVTFLAVFIILFSITSVCYRHFRALFLQGLRRE